MSQKARDNRRRRRCRSRQGQKPRRLRGFPFCGAGGHRRRSPVPRRRNAHWSDIRPPADSRRAGRAPDRRRAVPCHRPAADRRPDAADRHRRHHSRHVARARRGRNARRRKRRRAARARPLAAPPGGHRGHIRRRDRSARSGGRVRRADRCRMERRARRARHSARSASAVDWHGRVAGYGRPPFGPRFVFGPPQPQPMRCPADET